MRANQIYSLTVATAVLAAIGCADGQRSKGNGRGQHMYKTAGLGGGPSALNKTGDTAKVFSTGIDSKKQTTLTDDIALLDQGTDVGIGTATPLPEGMYVLAGWTTVFRSGSPWVQAIKSTVMTEVNRPDAVLAQLAADVTWVGALKDGTAKSTASITLPAQFTIEENTFKPDQSKRILTTTVNVQNKQLTMTDALADGNASTIAADFMTLWDAKRQGQSVLSVDDAMTFEIKSIKRTDASHLRIALVLLRSAQGTTTAGKTTAVTDNSVTKTFYLTYANVSAPKQAPAKAATPAPVANPAPGEADASALVPNHDGSPAVGPTLQ